MTPAAMMRFVDDLYADTGSGDFDTAAEMQADDFVAPEADCMPMAGAYRGRQPLRDLYRLGRGCWRGAF